MRAVVLDGPGRAVVREVPVPPLAAGDVLVEIERVGICGSDVSAFHGSRSVDYPLIMGHEAVGHVLDPGDTRLARGARVVIEPNIPCGVCAVCQRGRGNVCPGKRSLGMNAPGTFAALVAVPGEFVHVLPDEVSFEDGVGIEPLAVALHAFDLATVASGDLVGVIGCGAEGLLLVRVALLKGARVLAIDIRADRLEAASKLGAQHLALAGSRTDLCPEIVFEAAGAAPALELAVQLAAPGGRVIALGLGAEPVTLEPFGFVRRGLSLIGSLIYDHPTDFQHAIGLVERGTLRPSALVPDVVDGLDAIPAMLATSDRLGKVVVRL